MIQNEPRRVVVQAPAPKDAVVDTVLYGQPVFGIRFNGEILGMVWGDADEAAENLRALRRETTPEDIITRRGELAARKARAGKQAVSY